MKLSTLGIDRKFKSENTVFDFSYQLMECKTGGVRNCFLFCLPSIRSPIVPAENSLLLSQEIAELRALGSYTPTQVSFS